MITVTEDTFDAKPLVVTEKITEFGCRRQLGGQHYFRWFETEEDARVHHAAQVFAGHPGPVTLVKRTVYALEPEVVFEVVTA